MAYESIDKLKKYMQKKVDAIVTGEKVTFNINAHQLLDEIKEMERKARAFDEIKEFITRKLKEEEEEKPRTLLSDYDYGLYQAYDNVDDIIQEYLERADDER
ncbi:hypothetical protein [Staphylococcus gallinarum]|uniref:hypothetical protein n=1 Tax=Staphylococcus gallinarum TaxID=1293 RepID=UPI001E54BB0F|nr:hypothetical protein [Staphylococcus gallinarum]UEH02033.1 hypothetical protein K3U27_06700 [Staphylococcus gallinarum]